MTLGQKLRERAAELGLSNSEVARRAQLDERRYGNYIRDARKPDFATLVRICRVLLTTPNDLLLAATTGKDGQQSPSHRNLAEPVADYTSESKPDGQEKSLAELMAAARQLDEQDLAAFTAQIKAVVALRKKKRKPVKAARSRRSP